MDSSTQQQVLQLQVQQVGSIIQMLVASSEDMGIPIQESTRILLMEDIVIRHTLDILQVGLKMLENKELCMDILWIVMGWPQVAQHQQMFKNRVLLQLYKTYHMLQVSTRDVYIPVLHTYYVCISS